VSTQPATFDSTPDHVQTLAAELTRKTYAIALANKKAGSWLDLELELWRAVTESLRRTQAPASNAA
jgi:hypothetical protein